MNDIEDPRSKLRGIFDPHGIFIFLCSLTPWQATGNALAGIQLLIGELQKFRDAQHWAMGGGRRATGRK